MNMEGHTRTRTWMIGISTTCDNDYSYCVTCQTKAEDRCSIRYMVWREGIKREERTPIFPIVVSKIIQCL